MGIARRSIVATESKRKMKRTENHCVDCGLPCLGRSCPYSHVTVYYCDICGDEGAEYTIDGEDYCEECAKEYLKDTFNDLTISEQAEALNIDISSIN